MAQFLDGTQFPDLKSFLTEQGCRIKAHAQTWAAQEGRPFEYLQTKIRMEDRALLFAGSDDGARRFAILHTLIVNCDLVGAPPFEYLRDIFGRLANGWPQARLRDLLPAAWLVDQRRQQQPSDRAADAVDHAVPAAA